MKALIVSDEPVKRAALGQAMESIGWSVMEAAGPARAMEVARSDPPTVVVSDVFMPSVDGGAYCRSWKLDGTLAEIPFLFYTPEIPDEADLGFVGRLGADGRLGQGTDPEELKRQLDAVLEGVRAGRLPLGALPKSAGCPLTHNDVVGLVEGFRERAREERLVHEELQRARDRLERRSHALDQRVRGLLCIQSIHDLACGREVTIEVLCRRVVDRISEAFPIPEHTSVRIRLGESTFVSPEFAESPRLLSVSLCAQSPYLSGAIDVYFASEAERADGVLQDEERWLLDRLSSQFCLEVQRLEHKRRNALMARVDEALLPLRAEVAQQSDADLMTAYVRLGMRLTDSQMGCLQVLDADQIPEAVTWTFGESVALTPDEAQRAAMAGADVWGEAVGSQESVIRNQWVFGEDEIAPSEGPPRPLRFVVAPALTAGRVALLLGVGARQAPYREPESEALERVATALRRALKDRRAALAIKATNARLRLIQTAVEAASHSVVITDTQGRIEWVNPAFTRVTGYTFEEIIGENPRRLKSGDHTATFYESLWKTITAGEVWRGHLVNRRKDGSLLHENAIITPVRDDGGTVSHFIAIKEDVTEQRQLEEKLLRAQRMESIGLLAGGVAHDLNNVLAPIMMSVDMLRRDLPEPVKEQILNTLAKGCERGAGIIRQVLTFASGIAGERVSVQVRHLIKDLVAIARETFPKDVEISMSIPADLWLVLGDPAQLHQVFMNLAVNARDAMPTGGRLKIIGENLTLSREHEFLGDKIEPGRYICVSVEDTGTGIEAEHLSRIFDPFFTTKEPGKGTGLGLSTSLSIVRKHHGLLEVESALGQGCQFRVMLPATDVDVASSVDEPASAPRGHGEVILIVDDEAGVREVVARALEHCGYSVLKACDGAEAVGVYAAHPHGIDLVITDVIMPVMDGVALVRALKAVDPNARIVGCSGYSGDGPHGMRLKELQELGVKKLLNKPFAVRELLVAVAEELAQSARED